VSTSSIGDLRGRWTARIGSERSERGVGTEEHLLCRWTVIGPEGAGWVHCGWLVTARRRRESTDPAVGEAWARRPAEPGPGPRAPERRVPSVRRIGA